MKTLTKDDVRPIYDVTLGDGLVQAEWHHLTDQYRERLAEFANAILRRYAQPSERAIIERERKAWDAGCSFCCSRPNFHFVTSSGTQTERDRRYPLPKAEPAPVLTDEEVREMVADSRFVWSDVLVRNIERAVLTKFAEHTP